MYSSVPVHDDQERRIKAGFATDFMYLREESAQPWYRTRTTLAKVVFAVCSVLGILCFAVSSVSHLSRHPHMGLRGVECLHALGGGDSSRGGGFDVAIVKSERCKHVLHMYLRTAYWHELHLAASRGMEYFKAAAPSVGPNDTVVFDIDETSLSNIDDFRSCIKAGKPLKKPLQHAAPALAPILEVYQFLYASNYTVTFITGRGEADREHTVANLAAAGYGQQCPVANGVPVRTAAPCYLQLDLRAAGDTRLASVYKPEKRGQLMQRGFVVVGSFGDQFSDLAGENSARASFKLPNPMYYIL